MISGASYRGRPRFPRRLPGFPPNSDASSSPAKTLCPLLPLADTGFAALGHPFTENRGRILEDVVAIELFRREKEIYYFKNKRECDFIIKTGTRPTHAVQVCWELTRRNEKHELAGLADAHRSLGLSAGMILTYDQEGEREVNGLPVTILPVWRWLLSEEDTEISTGNRNSR